MQKRSVLKRFHKLIDIKTEITISRSVLFKKNAVK